MMKDVKQLEEEYGCNIPEKRVQIWEVQLRLWKELDRICKKYGLTYFFFWGALLGAVRHKGFIPWDDDIDVVMPRRDYDRLAEVAPGELTEPYFLLTPDTTGRSFFWFQRLIDESTTHVWNMSMDFVKNHQGIALDIVPLDGVPRKKMDRILHFWHCQIAFTLINNRGSEWSMLSRKGKLLRIASEVYCMGRTQQQCIRKLMRIQAKYGWDESGEIAEQAHYTRFQKENFEHVAYLEFEGAMAPVPGGYEKVLRRLYGDYMSLPPLKGRLVSEDDAWGYITDPNVSYRDYYESTINRRKALARMQSRKNLFKKYCGDD